MERFVKGDIVVLPFPFSNISATKKRPALIAATLNGDDFICCQITSEARFDEYAVELKNEDVKQGSLYQTSRIRPNRLFTADRSIVLYRIGALKEMKMKEVEEKIIKIFKI